VPYTFDQLAQQISGMLVSVRVTRVNAARARAAQLVKLRSRFDAVQRLTGVPSLWTMPTWDREGPSFSTYLGNGDPLSRPTTHVPRGRGGFASWEQGAVDALHLDGVDAVSSWTPARAVFQWEAWNGFGPRERGYVSGYVWAGTSFYDPPDGRGGKYVGDGAWSASAVDAQLGTVPLMLALLEADPTLAFTSPPALFPPLPPGTAPIESPAPRGPEDAAWLQASLNRIAVDPRTSSLLAAAAHSMPLVVDGNIGRVTRRVVSALQAASGIAVDGIAGPDTRRVLEGALAEIGGAS